MGLYEWYVVVSTVKKVLRFYKTLSVECVYSLVVYSIIYKYLTESELLYPLTLQHSYIQHSYIHWHGNIFDRYTEKFRKNDAKNCRYLQTKMKSLQSTENYEETNEPQVNNSNSNNNIDTELETEKMKFWFIVCAILSFLIVFKISFICFVVYYIINHLIVIYADIGTVRRWSHGGVNHIQPLVVNGTVLFQSTRMRSILNLCTPQANSCMQISFIDSYCDSLYVVSVGGRIYWGCRPTSRGVFCLSCLICARILKL